MISRVITTLAVIAGLIAIACVDMSAPDGPASISLLQLPAPSVIMGDSMRDSSGVARPVRVVAFDASGIPMAAVEVQILIADTLGVAHLTPSNLLVGDKRGTTRLFGQVRSMQTPAVSVPVTFRPAKLLEGQKPDTIRAVLTSDTTNVGKAVVSAVVRSVQDSASEGIIVRYALVGRVPGTRQGVAGLAVFIADDQGRPSAADTSNVTGMVSRTLTVRAAFLADTALVNGHTVDSATVELTASYRGAPLSGSPLRVTVPIRVAPPPA